MVQVKKREPIILYSLRPQPKQTSKNCVLYSVTYLVDKLLAIKGYPTVFDPEIIVNEIRDALDDHDGGTKPYDVLNYIWKNGFCNYRLKEKPVKLHSHYKNIIKKLKESPLLFGFKTYERKGGRVSGDTYKYPTGVHRSWHSTVLMGWDGENFLVQDPNYPEELKKMSVENYNLRAESVYKITL